MIGFQRVGKTETHVGCTYADHVIRIEASKLRSWYGARDVESRLGTTDVAIDMMRQSLMRSLRRGRRMLKKASSICQCMARVVCINEDNLEGSSELPEIRKLRDQLRRGDSRSNDRGGDTGPRRSVRALRRSGDGEWAELKDMLGNFFQRRLLAKTPSSRRESRSSRDEQDGVDMEQVACRIKKVQDLG